LNLFIHAIIIYLQEWVKHWFVLRGSALMYYRDPSAEDNGILDGVIDLGMVQKVTEIQVARNYGFEIVVCFLE
jgi:myosin phosphatase Rho-interacting protein